MMCSKYIYTLYIYIYTHRHIPLYVCIQYMYMHVYYVYRCCIVYIYILFVCVYVCMCMCVVCKHTHSYTHINRSWPHTWDATTLPGHERFKGKDQVVFATLSSCHTESVQYCFPWENSINVNTAFVSFTEFRVYLQSLICYFRLENKDWNSFLFKAGGSCLDYTQLSFIVVLLC